MSCLVDTNILTRIIHKTDPLHEVALDALAALRRQNEELCVVPQNLYELWVVCTRPLAQNGLGLSVAEMIVEVKTLKQLFTLLQDQATLFVEWEQLVAQYQVVGKNAHDARLVAAMSMVLVACSFSTRKIFSAIRESRLFLLSNWLPYPDR